MTYIDHEVKREVQSPVENRRSPIESENRAAHDSGSTTSSAQSEPNHQPGKLG